MNPTRQTIAAVLALGMIPAAWAAAPKADEALRAAIASDHRTPAYVQRDAARHPYETLSFFGIQPTMTVVELSPGGGWYTEILAPYLRDHGTYIAAAYREDSPRENRRGYTEIGRASCRERV